MKLFLYILKYLYRKPQHVFIRILAKIKAEKLEIAGINNAIIISPHPDDEVFGCGELIKSLCSAGKKVILIILSKGEAIARGTGLNEEIIVRERKKLTIRAARVLGLSSANIFYLDFPDGEFKSTPESEKYKMKRMIEEIQPDAVFYPHPWDGSSDHCVASMIIKESLKDVTTAQYYYCVWLWHHMKFTKVFSLDYRNSFLLNVKGKEKNKSVDIYVQAKHRNGLFYSGRLPMMFVKAVRWNYELFFKVN